MTVARPKTWTSSPVPLSRFRCHQWLQLVKMSNLPPYNLKTEGKVCYKGSIYIVSRTHEKSRKKRMLINRASRQWYKTRPTHGRKGGERGGRGGGALKQGSTSSYQYQESRNCQVPIIINNNIMSSKMPHLNLTCGHLNPILLPPHFLYPSLSLIDANCDAKDLYLGAYIWYEFAY